MASVEHIPEEELLAFADGELTRVEAGRVDGHVATCRECRVVLAELARSEQTSPARPSAQTGLTPWQVPGATLARGSSLGRYLVLDTVGAGGMGVVYAAYDPELDRRVALKLLRTGSGDPDAEARLLREARAMARLSHRNVVTVYDAGMLGERVFVAMELLAGDTLRRWLARGPRTVPEILEVFAQAGRGLAAAHEAGVVHRDFKPDNVIVGSDGRVSVLDFGLARPSGPALPIEETGIIAVPGEGLTEAGSVVGTPKYMAPEQREGKAASAASDQYSFCVALAEALHGGVPAELPRDGRVPAAVRAALVRGLSPEPERRFASMGELVAVLAARPRSRQVLGLALVAAAGLAGLGVALYQTRSEAHRCAGSAEKLAEAWSPRQRLALVAGAAGTPAEAAVTKAAALLDGWAGEWTAMRTQACEATRVRGEQSEDLMDRRMLCLDERLADFAALAGALASTPPDGLAKAADAAAALPAIADCGRSKALLDRTPPPRDPVLRARLDRTVAALADVKSLRSLGKIAEALPAAKSVAREAAALGYSPLAGEAWEMLGELQPLGGELDQAPDSLYRAAAAARAGGAWEVELAAWLELADDVGVQLHDRVQGERLLAVAESALSRLPDPERGRVRFLQERGRLLSTFGEGPAALADFRAAIALAEKLRGRDWAGLAPQWRSLAEALEKERQLDEAERAYRRCIALSETDDSLRARLDVPLAMLGGLLYRLHRYDEARAALERARAHAETPGSAPLRAAYVYEVLTAMERDAGRLDASLAAAEKLVKLLRGLPGVGPVLGEALYQRGFTLLARGDLPGADADFSEATRVLRAGLPKNDPELVFPLVGLGRLRTRRHDPRGASRVLDEALAIVAAAETAGATPASLVQQYDELGRALWDAGHRRDQAILLVRKARIACGPGCPAEDVKSFDEWLEAHRLPTLEQR